MKKTFAWALVLSWACIIFYMSSLPAPQAASNGMADFFVKKAAHVFEYAVLTALAIRAYTLSVERPKRKQMIYIWLIVVLYAISDEVHQGFVPSRGPHIRDVIIDSIASLVTVLISIKYYRINSVKTIG